MKHIGWVGLFILCAAGFASAVTFELDRGNVYEAKARFLVTKSSPSVDPITGDQSSLTYDPAFIYSQVEIMKSRSILEEVIHRLDVQEKWAEGEGKLSMDQAVQRLRKCVKLEPARNTSVITIVAYASDPEEAAQIANTYAEAYRDDCTDRVDIENRNAIQEMEQQLMKQSTIVSEAEERLQEIMIEQGITYPVSIDEYRLQQMLSQSLSAQKEMMIIEPKLSVLENLSSTNLVKVISSIDDVTALNAFQRLSEVEAEIEGLSDSIGERHPDRIRLENQKKQWTEYLTQRIDGLRLRLQTEYDIAKKSYECAKQSCLKQAGQSSPCKG
ncbi:MAG: hypothetical protein JXR40_11455 [Pontiellaceae bacterium]|nr:hypothetical protein [Pontiellaceae bacterium]